MLGKKYPDLEKPIYYSKSMSFLERWRDIRFHKNLWKVDERMLLLQAKIDGHEEGRVEGRAEGLEQGLEQGKLQIARNALAEGSTPEFVQKITGLSFDEIKKL